MTATRVPVKVRELVYARAEERCERCGIRPYAGSLHHRRPRGMGGDSRLETNLPANLLLLCGSGVTGCHGWIEDNRIEAKRLGLLVPAEHIPDETVVRLRYGTVLLDNDGFYRVVA